MQLLLLLLLICGSNAAIANAFHQMYSVYIKRKENNQFDFPVCIYPYVLCSSDQEYELYQTDK